VKKSGGETYSGFAQKIRMRTWHLTIIVLNKSAAPKEISQRGISNKSSPCETFTNSWPIFAP
jgi:hypothetical protein